MQKTYETYKDSGIEWIGNVPSHWEIFPMKYKVNLYNGNSIKDDEKPLYEDDSDAIPYIATKDVNVDNHSIDYKNGMYVKNIDHSFVRAPKGSSLMCIEGGSAGRKIGYTNQEVAFINKLCCFTTKDISILDNLYLYYYLQSSTFKNKFTSHLSGLIGGVSISEMKNFEVICPPLSEQQAIAEYLDKKCGNIDSLVVELEQQVTNLGTMKKAEISRVVTKGLNPDASLKDSGIEWIGEMPSHWNVVALKNLSRLITDGTHQTPNYIDEGIPFISIKDMSTGVIDFTDTKFISQEEHLILSQHAKVERGDILFSRIGTLGVFIKVNTDVVFDIFVSLGIIKLKNDEINTDYLVYYLSSENVMNYIHLVKAGGGTAAAKFNLGDVANTSVLLPNLFEQQAIAEYLDTYCAKVDATVKELQAQIADLKLYKQSIISEAVTGKIKVID